MACALKLAPDVAGVFFWVGSSHSTVVAWRHAGAGAEYVRSKQPTLSKGTAITRPAMGAQ